MAAYHALLGFTAWTLLLVLVIFSYRGFKFLGGTAINSWPRGMRSTTDAPIISRIADAHANCLENLPIFAVLVLTAAAMGRVEVIAPLAAYVLYARIAQTLAHLSGTGKINVLLRATFWSVQLVIFVMMFCKLFA